MSIGRFRSGQLIQLGTFKNGVTLFSSWVTAPIV